jgi:hypothetical protein
VIGVIGQVLLIGQCDCRILLDICAVLIGGHPDKGQPVTRQDGSLINHK